MSSSTSSAHSPSSSSSNEPKETTAGAPTSAIIEPKTNDEKLDMLIKKYLQYERVVQHKQYIERLVLEKNVHKLKNLIGKRLTFGTAGLRGSMGPGFSQMNDLVVIQTSQGLASYLLELDSKAAKEQGVIIGHDARHNSDRFARLAALAFLQKGIPVYFCDHIIPTPLIAFGVKHFGCCAGIVVTASHNPKNDNGYKVYFANGAQILSPHDRGIQEHIMMSANQEPWTRAWQHDILRPYSGSSEISPTTTPTTPTYTTTTTTTTGSSIQTQLLPKGWDELLFRIHGDLSKSYFAYIETLVNDRRPRNQSSNICITYTTMHGVGHMFLSRALDIAGFEDIFPVELQKKPDPNFSTVRFPNPEEAGALDLAFETAKHANSNLILANDPDADRCAAALYHPNTNYKRIFTGNEIGALLGWWIWYCYTTTADGSANGGNMKENFPTTDSSSSASYIAATQEQDETTEAAATTQQTDQMIIKKKPSDCYMISTAVSSKFLQSMAEIEGFHYVETLTGFKYMGNVADELIKKHSKHVLFAYEEAIGYMVDSTILDKDGISAAIQLAQCAAHVSFTYNRTLEQHLDWLYSVYGYHYSLNSYYICSDQAIIGEIFRNLQFSYPNSFTTNTTAKDGTKTTTFKVTRVRDLNNGYDSSTPNNKPTLPSSSTSYMVTFFVDNDITFTIRTSGTEPKIKYYSEIVSKLPALSASALATNNFNDKHQSAAKEAARDKLHRFVQAAIERCLRPIHYELEPAD